MRRQTGRRAALVARIALAALIGLATPRIAAAAAAPCDLPTL